MNPIGIKRHTVRAKSYRAAKPAPHHTQAGAMSATPVLHQHPPAKAALVPMRDPNATRCQHYGASSRHSARACQGVALLCVVAPNPSSGQRADTLPQTRSRTSKEPHRHPPYMLPLCKQQVGPRDPQGSAPYSKEPLIHLSPTELSALRSRRRGHSRRSRRHPWT